MSPIKAALVMPLAEQRGGCETQLLNLLAANAKTQRIAYTVCFLEHGSMADQVRRLGYPACVIEAGRLRQMPRYVSTVARLTDWLKAEAATHVVSWMEKAHLYAAPAAAFAGIPAAWWLRSIDPSGRLLKLISALPTAHTFACSRAALDAWRPDWQHLRAGVCYSAVNFDRFNPQVLGTPAQARARLNLPPDRPIVGIVARLQRWKGIHVFIDAAAEIVRKANAYFVIVGGEHDLEPGVLGELQQQSARLNLTDHLLFAGYQSNVPQWMQACDVLVHASTRPEPLGIVILEAMSLGKRVVAADEAGPREIITNGVDGRRTPPGDASALASAVVELLDPSPANERLSEAARARSLDFSATAMANRLADALERNFEPTGRTDGVGLQTELLLR